MKKHINIISISLILFTHWCFAQSDVPTPAPKQQRLTYLTNATIHTGEGTILQNATIGFDNGIITFIAENPVFKTDETMGTVINCNGKHIYPGLIATNTKIGLDEIEAVRATNDYAETGAFNPNVRAIIAYNTDSRVTPTIRSNGVLYAQVSPQGGVISGTSAVVQLDAWNWEDARVTEDGIWLNWPSMYSRKGWWGEPQGYEQNKNYEKQVKQIKDYFIQAMAYSKAPSPKKQNLRFEAMRNVFAKKHRVYVSVNYIKEIQHILTWAEELGISIVLAGARDSYMIADKLAEKKIPVILDNPHSLPSYNEEDLDQPYKTPYLLQKAGVLFCISIPGGYWQQRNLSFNAGTAAAYGLSKEEALQSITLNAAKILGIDKQLGSLAVGKAATLIVSEGDVLDMRSSDVIYAFIDGRQIDLNNKQKELNKKYMERYGLK